MQRRTFFRMLAGTAALCCCPGRELWAADPLKKGMVTFTFDDGLASVHEHALPIFKKRRLKATAAIIASRVQMTDNDDYLSVPQLNDMVRAGWEIASHSLTHTRPISIPHYYNQEPIVGWTADDQTGETFQTQYDYDLIAGIYQDGDPLVEVENLAELHKKKGSYFYDRPIAELHVNPKRVATPENLNIRAGSYQREMDVSKQKLKDLGFSINTFVAPYNYWPNDMKETSKSYYSQAVTGMDTDNRPESFDPYAIRRFMMHERDSVAHVTRLIKENALDFGGWVVFCFHGVGSSVGWEPYSADKLDAVTKFVETEGIPVVTIEEGAKIMRKLTGDSSQTKRS